MALSDKKTGTMGSPIDDIAYLARSEHRVRTLVALRDRPRTRSDLWEQTGVSSSTMRRTVRAFEERNWIRREGHVYETTQLGAFIASAMEELIGRIETERTLRDVWHWLPGDESGFTLEVCTDAVVTVAEPDAPYGPVNRFSELLAETDEFRFVGSDIAVLEPCKDVLRKRIVDGMETEIIDPPAVAKRILATYPDHCSEPLERPNFTVLLHDELPSYGVGLFDDRIAVSCYDQATGSVRLLIDTDVPAAWEWAESVYSSYQREARPLAEESLLE